jgi:outer membrane protein TolC
MVNLSFPLKTVAAGRVALDDAMVAGERFRAAKFGLQQRVLNAYYAYALLAERVRLQRQMVQWIELSERTAAARVHAGASQQDLAAARVDTLLAANQLQAMTAELPQQQARLNGLVGRPAETALSPPAVLPPARPLPADDANLLHLVSQNNPELTALARAVDSREHALEAARLQFIPDVNPFAGFTGSISQVAGVAVILPTTIPQIRAVIRESQAQIDAANAALRQAQNEKAAQLVATLAGLRDAERQVDLFTHQVVPIVEINTRSARAAFTTAQLELPPFIDRERLRLETLTQLATLRMTREQRLAELEALAGVDIETLERSTSEAIPAAEASNAH